jgi:hypothetical protein
VVGGPQPGRAGLIGPAGRGGLLGGVGAEQVVHGEPAAGRLGDQVGAGQLAQGVARPGRRQGGQAGRGRGRDVRAGVHAEEAEQPGGRFGQVAAGPREDGPHVGGGVPGSQRVQPAGGRPQLGGQGRQGPVGGAGGGGAGRGGAAGGDGEGQRQPGAQVDQLGHSRGLGGDPPPPEAPGQQLPCLRCGHDVQVHGQRALRRHQAGQLAAAGHQHQAARRARQQRADLLGVGGIVEQHQHPAARQQRPVQPLLVGQGGRDPRRRDAQRAQEAVQRGLRRHRLAARREAPQVDVELAVRELAGHLVRPVHGERGLPDAGGSGDGGDHHRPAARVTELAGQRVQLGAPPGELRRGGGQLPRDLPGRVRRGGRH